MDILTYNEVKNNIEQTLNRMYAEGVITKEQHQQIFVAWCDGLSVIIKAKLLESQVKQQLDAKAAQEQYDIEHFDETTMNKIDFDFYGACNYN